MNAGREILEILNQFAGGADTGRVAVRFFLPAFFWTVLAAVSCREWSRTRETKDRYIGIAAIMGIAREMIMFAAEHGRSRSLVSFGSLQPFYPPFEHMATMLSGIFIAAAFMNYLLRWRRFSRRYFLASTAVTAAIYTITAALWPVYLNTRPGAVFGSFWGDMAFRAAAVVFMGIALGAFLVGKSRGARVQAALLLGFAFLFLDEFLMILNLATGERYGGIYDPIRHNFHIWAIPLFLGVYWSDLRYRLNEALENIRQERSRSEAVIAAIGDGISMQDRDFRILYQNRIGKEMIGDHAGELCYRAYEKGDAPCEECPVARTFHDGKIHRSERQVDLPDRKCSFEITASPLKDSEGRVIAAVEVVRDVSERKRLHEEVAKSQKLESVGLLAGGLAHDFNNLLTTILGNISLAKLSIDTGHNPVDQLSEAEKASLRAADLTRQLLTFSKGGAPARKTASIMEIIRESAGFALSGSNVKAQFVTAEYIYPVDVDAGQMNQVFNNLIINAVQAMPGGGILRFCVNNVHLSDPGALPLPDGDYVKISVTDNGIGMPEELLPKIFDPYFSTKQKGNGLGLATVYSIMKKHDGWVAVESKPGAGTTFDLYLPASKTGIIPGHSKKQAILGGQGRVLFMDDEEAVRNTASKMLKRLGFDYAFAADGTEAIALYQQARSRGKPFDLVIMDLTIPRGMGGKEAVGKLLALDPDAVVIVSSGYSNDPVMADYKKHGFKGFIAKPYSLDDLGRELKRALAE